MHTTVQCTLSQVPNYLLLCFPCCSCHVCLTVASDEVVTVTCTSPVAPGFRINLTATAQQDQAGCLDIDRIVQDIVVNTRPTVVVTRPANASVCITPDSATSTQLLFRVSSINGEATVTPTVTGVANCTAEPATVSK
jgi:hypothetical protein